MTETEDGFYTPMGSSSSILVQYTIYDHPKDFPKHFVVRRFEIRAEGVFITPFYRLASTLEEARDHVPGSLLLFPRMAEDDPVIVETWT